MTTAYPSRSPGIEKKNIKFTKYKNFKDRVNITFI